MSYFQILNPKKSEALNSNYIELKFLGVWDLTFNGQLRLLLGLNFLGLGGNFGGQVEDLAAIVPSATHADGMAPMEGAAVLTF